MPRKVSILIPDCPHHIVQRGHNRNAVFVADEDYPFYLENLREWKEKLATSVYAWCLMTNHVHLVIEPTGRTETVSEMMKRLSGRQAAFTNKLEGRCGSLWQGRFKASPIQRDSYLSSCMRYVELNPVRAAMVNAPGNYPWSSYNVRMGKHCRPASSAILDFDTCYLGLAETELTRRRRYREFLSLPVAPEIRN